MKNDLLQIARNLYPDHFREMAADRTWMIEEFRKLAGQFRELHAEIVEVETYMKSFALTPGRCKKVVEELERGKIDRKTIFKQMTELRRVIKMTDNLLFGSASYGRRGPTATA